MLQEWYESGGNVDPRRLGRDGAQRLMLARVAAMLLSKVPPQGFAAKFLGETEERLSVSVTSAGKAGLKRAGIYQNSRGTCNSQSAQSLPYGWPLLFRYSLKENDPDEQADSVVVEAGGDRISFRRDAADAPIDPCGAPVPPDGVNSHRLLSDMLGVSEVDMLWQAEKSISLEWKSDDAFLTDLSKRVDFEEARLRATVSEFYAKGFLTMSEAEAIRPRLTVAVYDDRNPAQPANTALPHLTAKDSHTDLAVNR